MYNKRKVYGITLNHYLPSCLNLHDSFFLYEEFSIESYES